MAEGPSRAIMLFGTEEKVEPRRMLRAGPLSCELDGGNLRYVRIGGKEAIRAIAFIVRDKDWGTYNPAIEDLRIDQGAGGFEVSYEAICKDAAQELRYRAKIKGSADGTLGFEATARAVTDFVTNRTGFVVLHPIEGVAGEAVEVLHTDGRTERSTFPELIDPMCPFQDIRALTHQVLPGVRVRCTMQGDAFEMEDHRNWNDASYKTYVRPLAKPWPYTLKAGETSEQSVVLSVSGVVPRAAAAAGAVPVELWVGAADGSVPALGLSLRPEHAEATLQAADLVRKLGPQFLVCPFDSRIADGHAGPAVIGASTIPFDQRTGDPGKVLALYRAMAEATGAELVLEAVVACREPDGSPCGDEATMRADLAKIRDAVSAAGVRFARVAVAPASDLKCTLPGSVWPACPEAEALYAAAREAFPGVPVGGGMFSYFTELNRKRPPAAALDFVVHTSCPIVHACDDTTVTENLEALPHIVRSTRSFAGGKPYRAGPAAIGARDNPYGATATPNPAGGRVALAGMDPRQRGLLGAAWYLGYFAHMAAGGLEAVCLAAPVGEFGVVYAKMDYPQPWFDGHAGRGQRLVYPVYHVLRGLAAGAGRNRLETTLSNGSAVQALAWRANGRVVVWLANLTPAAQTVALEGLPARRGRIAVLDQDSFVAATADPDALAGLARESETDRLELGPYAVARLEVAG
jgi:D-apionolactonase